MFLCLAALYESWSVPFAVLLTVPTGILGALLSEYVLGMGGMILFHHMNAGLQDSIYMQIGIIMIIGLAAKNAILIVEFAKVRVDRGMEPVKAAIEAAGLKPGQDIVIVSCDGTRAIFQAMIEGKSNCTVEGNPLQGPLLMEMAKKVVAGDPVERTVFVKDSVYPAEIAPMAIQERKY